MNTATSSRAAVVCPTFTTTMDVTDEKVQMAELSVYVSDILGNMGEYLSFRQANPDQPYPSQMNQVVMNAMFADKNDDSWTTGLTGIDPATVQMMLTGVPWYSTRILPVLQNDLNEDGIRVQGINSDVCAFTTSSLISTPDASISPLPSYSMTTTQHHGDTISTTEQVVAPATTFNSDVKSTESEINTSISHTLVSPADSTSDYTAICTSTTPFMVESSSATTSSIVVGTSSTAIVVSINSVLRNSTNILETSTSHYTNLTTPISRRPDTTSTTNIYDNDTSLVTKTICDDACKSKSSKALAAEKTYLTTLFDGSTVTKTVCDTVCKSRKSEAAAAKKTITYTAPCIFSSTRVTCDKEGQSDKATTVTSINGRINTSDINYGTMGKENRDVDTNTSKEFSGYTSSCFTDYAFSEEGYKPTMTSMQIKSAISINEQENIGKTTDMGSTQTIVQQSENYAAKNFMGFGTGILAIAILLI